MKLEIEKKDFFSMLAKTQNIVEKKTTMPVLTNLLMEANEAGYFQVLATDLEVSLIDRVELPIIHSGKVVVNAKHLFEIVKELAEGNIFLTKMENNWIEIKQGRYLSKIIGISSDEYPSFPVYSGPFFHKINAEIFKGMIDKTIYCVSNEDARAHLGGVYFEQNAQAGYTMVATDGHRMSLVVRKENNSNSSNSGLNVGVVIPKKGLYEVRKLLDGFDGYFDLAIEGSQLIVKQNQTILMIRLIEGRYPNYNLFLPTKLQRKLKLNRESFLSSIRRIALLANQKSKIITFVLSDGKMEITSNNQDLGDAKEELEVEYNGEKIKVGFNARYIQDILSSMQDKEIDFELQDEQSPGLFRPYKDNSYTCVIMPMRL